MSAGQYLIQHSSVMDIKFHICLLLSICVAITSTMEQQDLFGVIAKDGKFYKRYPPQHEIDNWTGSATLIGTGLWKDFQHLFFHPDGTLYGVLNGKLYKGPPPTHALDNWLARATLVGSGGWNVFQKLFFHPNGILYGVVDDKLYRRTPPTHSQDSWLGSATRVGAHSFIGWFFFEFLFFDPNGILWAMPYDWTPDAGTLVAGAPPADESENWGITSKVVATHWYHFHHLFFMADGQLYGVKKDEFWRYSVSLSGVTSTNKIGLNSWSDFKFLLAPLRHE